MSNDKELYDFFKSNKADFQDDGFSKRVMKQLPKRYSILPQMIILFCAFLVTVSVIALQGAPLIEQLNEMAASLNNLQPPSNFVMAIYVFELILFAIAGFAIIHDVE
jgi:hypothetical protein